MTKDKEAAQASSAAWMEMRQFCSSNSDAIGLLHNAAHDYAAARCLLLNGLVSGGLVMGSQAIEKFLKAYILLKTPEKKVRDLGHSLSDLLNEADHLSPGLGLSKYSGAMIRYEDYYQNRYPDNKVELSGMYSSEIFALDEFVMFLNDNLPLPFDAKHFSGLYALVKSSSLNGGTVAPWERWIRHLNDALAPRLLQIEADFRTARKDLWPDTFK